MITPHASKMFLATACVFCILTADGGALFGYEITPLKPLFTITHDFLQPSDVAVGRDGRLYVLDGVNHCVKVFDGNGDFLFRFGGRGAAQGLLYYPLGLTTDSTGRVFVADTGNRRVQIFTPAGEPAAFFAIESPAGEKPPDPVDVALDEKRGHLYVIDNDNHHILVYDLATYRLLDRWGAEGKKSQEFNHPFFITVGKDASIFIVDVLNTRVQVWSPTGKAVSSIGAWGVDLGQLYRPKGVCVDAENRAFVSDSYLGVIQVFNRYGHFRSVLGTQEGIVMKWKTPVGITIDEHQRLYVVEMLANRVSAYEIVETPIEVIE